MKLKKIAALVVGLALSASLSVSVFAATGLNDAEQKINNEVLSLTATTQAGVTLGLSAAQKNQAITYMSLEGVDLTESDYIRLLAIGNEIKGLVEATDATSFATIPQNVVNRAVELAQEAAAIVGVELRINDLNARDFEIIYDTGNGTTVVGSTENAVKQSGIGFGIAAASLGVLFAALALCTVYVRKSRAVTA